MFQTSTLREICQAERLRQNGLVGTPMQKFDLPHFLSVVAIQPLCSGFAEPSLLIQGGNEKAFCENK